MSDTSGTVFWPAGERRFSGITRILLGFVIGALFALVPMYYFYMGREAALRAAAVPHADNPSAGEQRMSIAPAIASSASKPFASRLTYELSQLPDERPLPPPRTVVSRATAAEPPANDRVSNARPISAEPPAPRDRTREIEKEAQKQERRASPREQAKAAPGAPGPRVVEGREIDLKPPPKLPDTPTRPILAGTVPDMRAEIEAERRPVAAAPKKGNNQEAGARKGNGPEDGRKGLEARTLLAVAPVTSAAAAPAAAEPAATVAPKAPGANGSVEARLGATREWLAAAAPSTQVIQLMGAGSEEQLKGQLSALAKVLEPGKLYIFRTKAQGKPSITVVYGGYADRQAALEALEKLPPSLAANKPVLRTVNGIRTEITQHGTQE